MIKKLIFFDLGRCLSDHYGNGWTLGRLLLFELKLLIKIKQSKLSASQTSQQRMNTSVKTQCLLGATTLLATLSNAQEVKTLLNNAVERNLQNIWGEVDKDSLDNGSNNQTDPTPTPEEETTPPTDDESTKPTVEES